MTAFPRTAAFLLTVAACAVCCVGCGAPRHWSPRPDYDLPMGFSGTYRFGLVLGGEVPAGPTDREAIARLASGPASPGFGPFVEPLSIAAPADVDPVDEQPAPERSSSSRPHPPADVATPLFPPVVPEVRPAPRPFAVPGSIGPEAKNRRQADGPVAMMTGRTNERLRDGPARPSLLSTTTPVRR